jgi:hypothetical protein
MRKDGSFIKLERLKQIKTQVAKNLPNPVSIDKTVIWIQLNIGLTEERAKEYLDLVVEGAGWVVSDGAIKAEA